MMLHNSQQFLGPLHDQMMLIINFDILDRSLNQHLPDKINQPGEPLADNLEIRIGGEVSSPVAILVPVGHEIKLSRLYLVLAPVGLDCLEVVFGVAVLVFGTRGVF
jgi:hypothetical protein